MTYEEYLRDRQQIVDRCAKIVEEAIAERERATHALYELFRHGERRHNNMEVHMSMPGGVAFPRESRFRR